MVEKIQSEERLRIETLRGISLLADYLDSSSIVSILWMGALSSAIIGAFFVLTFSSFVLGLLTLYFGVVFAIYGVFLRSRFRRRFNRRYETLFRPLLTQSSDYNAIVRDLDLRVNHLLVELAEKEGELARARDDLRDTELRTQRLKLERNKEKHSAGSPSEKS